MLTIYHNPRCTKSRQTLSRIQDSGEEYTIVDYLNDAPSEEALRELVQKLGLPVEYLVRKNETLFKENFSGMDIGEDQWYKILSENPKLIERPIVVRGEQAIIGRPPENVEKLLPS